MTQKLQKHLNPEIWKAALFIDHAEDKHEAQQRIEFLLKEKGDEFMAYCMAILCLPQLMEMVKHTQEYKDHFKNKVTKKYH